MFKWFAQWVNDRRWAANMLRARRFRRSLTAERKRRYDRSLGSIDVVFDLEIEDHLDAMGEVYGLRRKLP